MKTKILNLKFIFMCILCGVMLCAPLAFSHLATGIFAAPIKTGYIVSNSQPNEVTFDYPGMENVSSFSVTVEIIEYSFSVGDSITYYYLKLNSNESKYRHVLTGEEVAISITEENSSSACTFNPLAFSNGGVGTYQIIATIYDASLGDFVSPKALTIIINPPLDSSYSLVIDKIEEQSMTGGLGVFHFFAKMYLGDVEVDINDFRINWYFAGDSKIYSQRTNFQWNPTEVGNYTVYAEIVDNDGIATNIHSDFLSVTVAYDRSVTMLVYVLIFAGLCLISVIISTIVSVKRERVW